MIFIATVAFFRKVSADRAVGLVFHHLGAVLRWTGVLDKRPALGPSWISWLFVKAFPKGTPMAWPRKRRFSIETPPSTTIWARPRTKASPHAASALGRRRETEQWWNHWSPCSWRTPVKSILVSSKKHILKNTASSLCLCWPHM